jgi:hypothetical protein
MFTPTQTAKAIQAPIQSKMNTPSHQGGGVIGAVDSSARRAA